MTPARHFSNLNLPAHEMNRHHNSRRLLNGAKQSVHILERYLQNYYGVRGAVAAGSAIASAATPYLAAGTAGL